jgi:L-threonylcarbamoyladenylate synthase
MPLESLSESRKIFPPTREAIDRAADILKNGGIVAFPTETVYGLGANALDESAVKKIFAAKGRPGDNPLILHVSNIKEASNYGDITPQAELLMQHFWPGPLTIILYSLDTVPLVTRGLLETVALRVPMNYAAQDLIRGSGLPIAAPSANKSGRPSPTTAEAVIRDLGESVDMVIDSGETAIGLESTVIDATEERIAILRPGGVTREMLERIVDVAPESAPSLAHRSPGTRYRHYAPSIPLILWEAEESDVFGRVTGRWCYMGLRTPPEGYVKKIVFGSMNEYAHNLFGSLRELESCGANIIIADLPGNNGLGEAIRNRLSRAASAL